MASVIDELVIAIAQLLHECHLLEFDFAIIATPLIVLSRALYTKYVITDSTCMSYCIAALIYCLCGAELLMMAWPIIRCFPANFGM